MTRNVEEFYTKNAGLLNFTIKVLKYIPALERLWQKNLQFHPEMRILDVGCGNGALTKTLFTVSREVKIESVHFFAFDVTQTLLDEFRLWILQKEITCIRTLKADMREMERLPFRWCSFDLICSSGVLEYLDEIEIARTLKKLCKLLKSGGKLIVMGSHKHPINYVLIHWLYRANLYSRKKFIQMLKSAGFHKIICWRFPFPYYHLNLWGYILVAEK